MASPWSPRHSHRGVVGGEVDHVPGSGVESKLHVGAVEVCEEGIGLHVASNIVCNVCWVYIMCEVQIRSRRLIVLTVNSDVGLGIDGAQKRAILDNAAEVDGAPVGHGGEHTGDETVAELVDRLVDLARKRG